MAQGRYTRIISMIKWIRTSRLSIKNALSVAGRQMLKRRRDGIDNLRVRMQLFIGTILVDLPCAMGV